MTAQEILKALDERTSTLHISQILSELQTVIERATFSQLHVRQQNRNEVTEAEINLLFEDQVSSDMLAFVHWLNEQKMLAVVSDKTGLLFLDYSTKYYKSIKEVQFLSAIVLSDGCRSEVREKLSRKYGAGARIVFEVSPSLVAGFAIKDGSLSVDRSLRAFSFDRIKQFVSAGVGHREAVNG